MFALSTSCYDLAQGSPQALCRFLKENAIPQVELEYRIPRPVLPQLKADLKAAGISTVSVHNICPRCDDTPPGIPANTFFHLAHLDPEIRRRALELTRGTLELAHELEARAVVLHCGHVEMSNDFGLMKGIYDQGRIDTPQAQELRETQAAVRRRHLPPHRDALFFSLEALAAAADRYGVVLGLENRFYFHQLPGLDEFKEIFRKFAGAPLGYWHDSGHAWVNKQLGYLAPGELPDTLESHLVGMHLHDSRGLDDHLPPGSGEMELGSLMTRLPAGAPLVMELAPGTPLDQVAQGAAWVRKHLTHKPLSGAPEGPQGKDPAAEDRRP